MSPPPSPPPPTTTTRRTTAVAAGVGGTNCDNNNDDIIVLHLRIISTNDVYELDNWAKAKTAIDYYRDNAPNPNNTIFILAGDFLSPSLLSNIDKGESMIDIMNNCGVDYVCFGNHEADLSMDELNKRIEESNFIWINTNIPDMPLYNNNNNKVKSHVILDITNNNNNTNTKSSRSSSSLKDKIRQGMINPNNCTHIDCNDDDDDDVLFIIKKVHLLGLLTDDKSLYKDGSFGGAKIKPVIGTTIEYINNMINNNDHDHDDDDADVVVSIIPITHQSIKYDRELGKIILQDYYYNKSCKNNNTIVIEIPLIIGGHDHDAYVEDINNEIRIAKAGCDIENILIFDLSWKYNINNNMMILDDIFVNLVSVKDFDPDPNIQLLVEKHNKKLDDNNTYIIPTSSSSTSLEYSNYYNRLLPIRYSVLCDNVDIIRLFKYNHKTSCTSGGSSSWLFNNNDNNNILLLSSKNIRLHQTTIGTFIASSIRNGMSIYNMMILLDNNKLIIQNRSSDNNSSSITHSSSSSSSGGVVDCCIYPSGAIRRCYVYNNNSTFTYNDLKSEIPYNDDVVIIPIPGLILRDSVKYSRRNSKATGGYFQLCDAIQVDNNDPSMIISIANKPLYLHKYYRVALPLVTLQGLDNNEILTSWWQHVQEQGGEEYNIDKMIKLPAKPAIIIFYSIIRWASINLSPTTTSSSSSSSSSSHKHSSSSCSCYCCDDDDDNCIAFINAQYLAKIANIESVRSHAFHNFLLVGGLNPIPVIKEDINNDNNKKKMDNDKKEMDNDKKEMDNDKKEMDNDKKEMDNDKKEMDNDKKEMDNDKKEMDSDKKEMEEEAKDDDDDLKYKWFFNVSDTLKAKRHAHYFLSNLKQQQHRKKTEERRIIEDKDFVVYSENKHLHRKETDNEENHKHSTTMINNNCNNNYHCCLVGNSAVVSSSINTSSSKVAVGIDRNEWSSYLII